MTKSIKIAVDAMGGDNSPKKIIEGIEIYYNENQDVFYNIFGDKNVIEKLILNKSIKICNTKYYARMDSDDISMLHRLEVQYNFLILEPKV